MPSLVILDKKLQAWRIPCVLSASPPPGTCALYRSAPVTTMVHARSKRSTKFKHRLSKWLTYSVEKSLVVGQITCKCPARAVCTCGHVLIQCRYALVIVYRCAEFDVSSSKVAIRRIPRMLSAPPPSSTCLLHQSAMAKTVSCFHPLHLATHQV